MGRRHRAVVSGNVADRLRAVFAALEEVGHVIAGLLAFVELGQGSLRQRIIFHFIVRLATQHATADK